MSDATKLKALKVVMIAIGVFSLVGIPMVIQLWPSGWVWEPRQSDYEGMMGAVYAGLALCLLWAVRNPVRHIIMVWAFIVSSLFHGGVMAVLTLTQEAERAHLAGDVLFNLVIIILLLLFIPWGLVRARGEA